MRRLRTCVENWPGCETGMYDPRCCRFPKSCSCTVYDPEHVKESDLEPEASPGGDKLTCLSCGTEGVGIGFEHKCDPIAAREERARIVKWLRWVCRRARTDMAARDALDLLTGRDTGSTLSDVAAAIEHGDHLSSGPTKE